MVFCFEGFGQAVDEYGHSVKHGTGSHGVKTADRGVFDTRENLQHADNRDRISQCPEDKHSDGRVALDRVHGF